MVDPGAAGNIRHRPGVGLEGAAELTVEGGALMLRKPATCVRTGWAEAAAKIAESADDAPVMGEFGNKADADLTW